MDANPKRAGLPPDLYVEPTIPKQRQEEVRIVKSGLDIFGPNGSAFETLLIESHVEALRRQVHLQALRQVSAIATSVGDKDAAWIRR